tara:strand:- start:100 stop:342 length:243 start_codon:yes stop_codon:yes gene_type:complete
MLKKLFCTPIMKDINAQVEAVDDLINVNYDLFHDLYLMDKEKGRRAIIRRIKKRNYFGQNYAHHIVADLLDHFDKIEEVK